MRTLRVWCAAVMVAFVGWPSLAAAQGSQVKIASFRSFVFLPVWVAKEGGFFAKEGINAEVLFFSSGTEMTAAMLSQSVQFASTMADRPMLLRERGQQTRHLIALTTQAPYSLVVPIGSPIARGDLAALKGKRIAITQKGSATDVAMRAILRPSGIDPDKDVVLMALGPHENGIAALKAGQVDAVILSEPATTVAISKEKLGKVILDLRQGDGPAGASRSTFATLQATEEFVKGNPEVIGRVISALCKATKAVREDPRKFVPVAKKYFPNVEDDVLERALLGESSSYGSEITAEMIKSVSDINVAVAVIKGPHGLEDVVVAAEHRSHWRC